MKFQVYVKILNENLRRILVSKYPMRLHKTIKFFAQNIRNHYWIGFILLVVPDLRRWLLVCFTVTHPEYVFKVTSQVPHECCWCSCRKGEEREAWAMIKSYFRVLTKSHCMRLYLHSVCTRLLAYHEMFWHFNYD